MPHLPSTRRRPAALLGALALGLAGAAAPAQGAVKLVVRGHGFGHGVGLSQWGAYGYAIHGTGYRDILSHYYSGTALGSAPAGRTVSVLLAEGRDAVRITEATRAGGRALDPTRVYEVRLRGAAGTVVREVGGKVVLRTPGAVAVSRGGEPVKLLGGSGAGVTDGEYRGSLAVRPGGGRLDVVDVVGLEDYVRGVVGGESPASWPAAALEAQAVAARTYAITTDAGGTGFDQYADTRSQVYRGFAAETPSTDAAVAATRGQVVTYDGVPVTTFFFSTSGGRTEDVENAFLGSPPEPWLRSVKDPYDGLSPRHSWRVVFTRAQAERRLGSLVRGHLRRIRVLSRGVSPRVVRAAVVGTRGTVDTTGPVLRARLGLDDTWASFRVTGGRVAPEVQSATPDEPDPTLDQTGGAAARTTLVGTVRHPERGAWVRIEVRRHGRWAVDGWTVIDAAGRYRALVPAASAYRVRSGLAGPLG